MSASAPRMSASLATPTILFALSRGLPMEQLTAITRMGLGDLMDPEAWVPEHVVPRVWLLLAEHFPGEPLSLQLAALAPRSYFGTLGRLLRFAPDLRELLRLFVRNISLLSDTAQSRFQEDQPESYLTLYHPMDDVDGGYGAEVGVGVGVRILAECFGASRVVLRVAFRHAPLFALAHYERFFGVPVRFNAPSNAVFFPTHTLDQVNPACVPGLQVYLEAHLSALRRQLGVHVPSKLLARAQDAVVRNALRGEYGVAALAKHLGMSARSLQRGLSEEGTSAGLLLEQARRAHATQLLRDPDLSVEDVAQLTGYSSARSFRRAYTRWTGLSPARARSQNP